MAEAAFNTIAEIQRMRDAGVPQAQAEAITLSIHSGVTGGVATKADLERVEERLGGEIKLVRKDVEALDKKIDTSIAALDKKIDTSIAALDTKIDTVEERLSSDIKALDQKIDTSIAALDQKIDTSIAALDQKIDLVKDSLETKMEKLSANLGEQIAKGQAVQLRWLIGLFIGFFVSMGGLILGALRILVQSG